MVEVSYRPGCCQILPKTSIVMKNILFPLFLLVSISIKAQSPVGTWKTIDDNTGQPKSNVEIYEADGKLFGKVTKLLQHSPDRTCEKCPGERKGRKVMGMVILENMAAKKGMWKGGRILDPENGKWYTCELWLKEGDPNQLQLRGYVAFFYRTQTWQRVE